MESLKKCLSPKVIGGLAFAGLVVAIIDLSLFKSALPFLILAICPLSMLVMVLMMKGKH